MEARRTILYVLLVSILTTLLSACGAFWGESRPRKVVVDGPTVTLAWDAPQAGRPSGAVTGYRVYARPRGSSSWRYLGSVEPSGSPSFTITVGEGRLDYGQYEFAVTTVATGGAESEKHTSLDLAADPVSGWYVDWYGPPAWYLDWQSEEEQGRR